MEQHYFKEFLPGLKRSYRVEKVSGDSVLKISFTGILKRNDVIICTAQILENYLERSGDEEDEGVDLSGTASHHFLASRIKESRSERRNFLWSDFKVVVFFLISFI